MYIKVDNDDEETIMKMMMVMMMMMMMMTRKRNCKWASRTVGRENNHFEHKGGRTDRRVGLCKEGTLL